MERTRGLSWIVGFGLLLSGIALPLEATRAEAQLSAAETRCRRVLHNGAQRYYRTLLSKQASCHRLRMIGKLSPLRDCNDPNRLPSGLILSVLETHMQRRAQNACSGPPAAMGFETCEAPCGNINIRTFADVGRCNACLVRRQGEITTRSLFGTPPVFGSNTREVRCQMSVGEETVRFVTSLLTSQWRCQFLQDRGAISAGIDCTRFDLFGIYLRAREILDRRIPEICRGSMIARLDGCSTSPDVLNCITDESSEGADLIFRSVFPNRGSRGKGVFVTSKSFTGAEIGGVAGADALCQQAASSAATPLRGTYRAWISDGTESPATRFFRAPVPYFLIRGGTISPNFSTLVATNPEFAIDIDENGDPVIFEAPVWTGTNGNGEAAAGGAAATCNGWTSDEGTGVIGLPYFIGGGLWSNSAAVDCGRRGHLYCFEQ